MLHPVADDNRRVNALFTPIISCTSNGAATADYLTHLEYSSVSFLALFRPFLSFSLGFLLGSDIIYLGWFFFFNCLDLFLGFSGDAPIGLPLVATSGGVQICSNSVEGN